ncbi:hypothetical protein D9M73_117590 [compost metagenome]
MAEEQLAHAAVGVGEHVQASVDIDHALVQMHGAARLAGHRLGHESGADVVLEGGLAQGALEHENLVGQVQRVAVTEVDFHLRGAFLVNQRVQVQALGLAPGVHVLEQRVELVGGIDGERLPASLLASGAAHRRLQRVVRVVATLGQVELHFRRHDRLPALVGIEFQYFLEHVTRRQLDRVALFVVRVVNDLRRRLDGPGYEKHRFLVGAADHVDVGRVEQFVIDVVFDVIPGNRL